MLCLTRKTNQEVVIGGGAIRIKVVRIDGNRVSLGITAPRNIQVDRAEVAEDRRAEALELELAGVA